jgi:hypothetical protein
MPNKWSEVFSIQVENARWLIDRETARIEGIHERASYLLGFTGVILAILPVALTPILDIRLLAVKWIAFVLVGLAAVFLSGGALLSLLAISVKKYSEVPVKGMQLSWVDWSSKLDGNSEADAAQVLADIANALMGRTPQADESAILAIRAQGDVRAQRLKISVWLATAGILALGALFLVLAGSRI